MAGDLTPKQALFVKEYLIDLNATQAAIRAGYSEKTAYAIGEQNLRKLEISSAIQSALAERSARLEINADSVLASIKEVTEKCCKAVEREDGTIDAQAANAAFRGHELLGKHLKLFTEKHEVTLNASEALAEIFGEVCRGKE